MIVLQFVSGEGIESEAIEAYSHGVVSHVDAVMPDGKLLGARLEGGVQIREPDYEKFDRIVRVQVPTLPTVVDDFYDWLKTQIGKPYDIAAIAAFGFGRNWREDGTWYCAELIAAGLERHYFPYPLVSPTNRITPADLLLVLSALVPVHLEPT